MSLGQESQVERGMEEYGLQKIGPARRDFRLEKAEVAWFSKEETTQDHEIRDMGLYLGRHGVLSTSERKCQAVDAQSQGEGLDRGCVPGCKHVKRLIGAGSSERYSSHWAHQWLFFKQNPTQKVTSHPPEMDPS